MFDNKKSIVDKRLLVNIAKGTTAWAVMTALCAAPALLDSADPLLSYLIVAEFCGVWLPCILWAGNRGRDKNFVGNFYVDMFDRAKQKAQGILSANKKLKTK